MIFLIVLLEAELLIYVGVTTIGHTDFKFHKNLRQNFFFDIEGFGKIFQIQRLLYVKKKIVSDFDETQNSYGLGIPDMKFEWKRRQNFFLT